MVLYTAFNIFLTNRKVIQSNLDFRKGKLLFVKILDFWAFLYFLNDDPYFRTLSYHRIGPIKAMLFNGIDREPAIFRFLDT